MGFKSLLVVEKKVLLAYIIRNRLPWTGREGGRGAMNGDLSSRLLGNEDESGAVYQRRRQIADESETYADDPDRGRWARRDR
jgi:hypothetical protein